MFSYIVFVILSLIFFKLIVDNARLRIRQRELFKKSLQLVADKELLLQKIESKQDEVDIEKTDGFLKFVTQSREWAFDYINTVQSGIHKFKTEAGPAIQYFDTYGDAMWTPLSDGMVKISAAYKELSTLIPDDYQKLLEDYDKLDT
jgi:hypothetical protein